MKIWITVLCAVALLVGCAGKKDAGVDTPDVVDAPKPAIEAPPAAVEAPKVVVDGDQLELRDGLFYFKGEPFTGVAVKKYDNGQKEWEATLKDGKKHGLWTEWYENGQKVFEATFKDGELISYNEWDEDGKPLWQDQGGEAPDLVDAPNFVVDPEQLERRRDGLRYFEGKPFTGVAVEKWPNGQKSYEGTWKDGEEISTKSWDEDGKLK